MRRFMVSPSMVVAVVAVVLSVTGSAVAAKLITGKQIKDGTVTQKDLSKALRSQLAKAGTPGPKGDLGPKGDPGPATGSAGGALSGTYPNPILAAGSVSTTNLATLPAVVVKKPTTQSIGGGSTVLSYDTEEFDTAGLFSPAISTQRLAAPVAGIYLVSATVEWSSDANGRRLLRIKRSAESSAIATDSVQATSVGNTVQTLTRLARLAAGDYITVDASHTAAGSLDLNVQAVSLNWVGP